MEGHALSCPKYFGDYTVLEAVLLVRLHQTAVILSDVPAGLGPKDLSYLRNATCI
ncbi:MAG: hypothetical protein ACJ8M1_05235 [Chthoniobacterales bacterium]